MVASGRRCLAALDQTVTALRSAKVHIRETVTNRGRVIEHQVSSGRRSERRPSRVLGRCARTDAAGRRAPSIDDGTSPDL
jgi:hypothetical protein